MIIEIGTNLSNVLLTFLSNVLLTFFICCAVSVAFKAICGGYSK
jgi:hypothetical protein